MQGSQLDTEFRIIGKEQDSFIESFIGEPLAKIKTSGHFVIIIEILDKLLEAEEIAEKFSETFRKSYYSEDAQEVDPFTRLENTLKELNELATQLETEEGLELKKLNIAICTLVGNELFLAKANDAEMYLNRGGGLTTISDGLSEGIVNQGEDLFKNISSGRLKAEDQVILSTGRLLRYATKTELTRCLTGKSLQNGLADINAQISTEVLGRVGVIGFLYKEKTVKAKSESLIGKVKGLKGMIHSLNFIGHGDAKAKPVSRELAEPVMPKQAEMIQQAASKSQAVVTGHAQKILNYIPQKEIVGFVKNAAGAIAKAAKTHKKLSGIIIIGVLLLLVLGSFQADTWQANRELKQMLVEIRTEIAEVKTQTNKQTAATMLASIEEKLRPALDTRASRAEASILLDEVNQLRFAFDEVTEFADLTPLVDITRVSNEDTSLGFFQINETLYIYNEKEIIEILLSGTKDPVTVSTNGRIRDAAVLPDENAAYFLLDNQRILEYKDSIARLIDTEDEEYKPATAIAGFGSRLYMIDNTEQQIWRYQKNRENFGPAEAYLNNDDLPQSKDVTIDGAIYVLTQNNQINKFFTGEKDNFRIDNAPLLSPQNPTKIRTDFDSSFVYVLDAAKNRVMVYFKNQETQNLEYLQQYYFPQLSQLKDFWIQEANKKLYLLNDNQLYVVTLD